MPERSTPEFVDVEIVVGETARAAKAEEERERKSRRKIENDADE